MPDTEVLAGAPVTGVKKSCGVTGLPVVTTNVADTPPMVRVVAVVVPGAADDKRRTLTMLPFPIVAGTVLDQSLQVAPPSLDTAYSPPALMEMAAPVLMPATVMLLDSIAVLVATPVWLEKLNAVGVDMGPRVVTLNVPGPVAVGMVRTTVVVVPAVGADV
jgi:hypothetical protein